MKIRNLFLYIYQKQGGTSVKKILSDKINVCGFKINGELVKYNKNTHIGINKEQFEKYKDYFKFVFVRHPYDWIKSYYNFHSNKSKFYKNLTLKKIENTITVNFDKWLTNLNNFNQTDFFTNNDEILVNKVCKLEKFNIDTIKNLNDKQKEMIQKICAKDFRLLNYKY